MTKSIQIEIKKKTLYFCPYQTEDDKLLHFYQGDTVTVKLDPIKVRGNLLKTATLFFD